MNYRKIVYMPSWRLYFRRLYNINNKVRMKNSWLNILRLYIRDKIRNSLIWSKNIFEMMLEKLQVGEIKNYEKTYLFTRTACMKKWVLNLWSLILRELVVAKWRFWHYWFELYVFFDATLFGGVNFELTKIKKNLSERMVLRSLKMQEVHMHNITPKRQHLHARVSNPMCSYAYPNVNAHINTVNTRRAQTLDDRFGGGIRDLRS